MGQYQGTKLVYKAHVSLGAGMKYIKEHGYEQISECRNPMFPKYEYESITEDQIKDLLALKNGVQHNVKEVNN
ncbi:MAG TPA: hypothetical protein DHW61_12760 [Lachnoclostridium phytofermentans]|uniref:Uncharacterized protein n=2 Tax=Lachnoclostridium TaxID=1506553 RepID=A0A3D2X958_9FIRM|nr:hypothetical protein [Lachnoclostridium phytofermentans]